MTKRGYDVHVFNTPEAPHLEGRFRKLPDESGIRVVNGYKRLEQNRYKIILFTLLFATLIVLIILFIGNYFPSETTLGSQHDENEAEKTARIALFISYGDRKMIYQEWEGAVNEYVQALKITPEDLHIKAKYNEAMLNLCIYEGKYCDFD